MAASNPLPVSFNSNCFSATWIQLGKNGAYLSNSCNQSAFVQFACYSDNGLFISNVNRNFLCKKSTTKKKKINEKNITKKK